MENSILGINIFDNLLKRNNFDLFGNDRRENLHFGKIYLQLFRELFSVYWIDHPLDKEKTILSLREKYALGNSQVLDIGFGDPDDFKNPLPYRGETLLILKKSLITSVHRDGMYIYYGSCISRHEIDEISDIANSHKEIFEKEDRKFYMVAQSSSGFSLNDFKVKKYELNAEENYNDDFMPINNIIKQNLEKKETNGLVMLHGTYGTGKTYYIRHLISSVNNKFIYLPLYMVSSLNSPEFIPFIAEHNGSVLILEDCENYLADRLSGNDHGSALSNLLNLGDGLLSDALSIKVICTFNANIKKIDNALLRKGRLIARYEFKELETKKAQALAFKLGKDALIDKPMTLSDIYNIEEKSFEMGDNRKVGFSYA